MTERPAPTRPKRPAARRARLAVTALGVAAVFSVATALGITDERARQQELSAASPSPLAATSQTTAPSASATPQVPPPIRLKPHKVVRVVRVGGGTSAAPASGGGAPAARVAAPAPASAPVARTSGSR